MKTLAKTFVSFFLIASIYSCYTPRYVYSPSTQNIPLLHQKNDLEFSGFYAGSMNAFQGKGNYNHGFDLHSAWAPFNHFGIMLNETARWEKNGGNDSFYGGDSSLLSYKRNFTELAVGYFSSSKNNMKMLLQIFGGAAFGWSDISDQYISNSIRSNKYHNSNVTKIFMQPAIAYSIGKNFSAGLASRFTAVIFTKIHTNYSATELDNYILDSLTVSPVFFWEPALNYTFGFKKFPVKFRLQASMSVLLNHRFVEHRSTNIGLGIVADISKKKKTVDKDTKK